MNLGGTDFSDFLLLFIQVYRPYATSDYERPTPNLLTDINIHSDTQAEPRKLSSLTLYIDLWQEGKPAPGQNPPVISPPVVIFRRIGVRAEIRTQNPVLSNTRLAKMVPLSHRRRRILVTLIPVHAVIMDEPANQSVKKGLRLSYIFMTLPMQESEFNWSQDQVHAVNIHTSKKG
jgi:hypothetical protein